MRDAHNSRRGCARMVHELMSAAALVFDPRGSSKWPPKLTVVKD